MRIVRACPRDFRWGPTSPVLDNVLEFTDTNMTIYYEINFPSPPAPVTRLTQAPGQAPAPSPPLHPRNNETSETPDASVDTCTFRQVYFSNALVMRLDAIPARKIRAFLRECVCERERGGEERERGRERVNGVRSTWPGDGTNGGA